MKRNNAAVRIPPAPPSSSSAPYKPVQIKHPPSKPKRGVPDSKGSLTTFLNTSTSSSSTHTLSDVNITFSQQQTEDPIYQNVVHKSQSGNDTDTLTDVQFSLSCDTSSKSRDSLSDVTISFSGSHDDTSRATLVPGIEPDPQPIYQNVERSVEDILDEEFLKMSMERTAEPGTNYIDVTISRPIRILSVSNPEEASSANTLNYLSIGSLSSPSYENTGPNFQADDDDVVYSVPRVGPRVSPEKYDSITRSAEPSSGLLNNNNNITCTPVSFRTSPSPTPAPNSLDDEVYAVPRAGPRVSPERYDSTTRSAEPLNTTPVSMKTPTTSSLAPTNNTIYKEPSSIFLGVSSDRINRAHSTGSSLASSRSTMTTIQDSGTMTTIQDSGSERSQSNAGELSSSLDDFLVMRRRQKIAPRKPRAFSELITPRDNHPGGWLEALKQSVFGTSAPAQNPPSKFYVGSSGCGYERIEPEPEPITDRIRRNLPESLVTPLTPALFPIPQPSPSVFYTEEEHIYSTSDTIGSLSYPVLGVGNVGYRDPQVARVERAESSIPVTNKSQYQFLADSTSDKSHATFDKPHSTSDKPHISSQSDTVIRRAASPRPQKQKLCRVSELKKMFETSDTDSDGQLESGTSDSDQEDLLQIQNRKEIVSQQFSSDS